jgi:surface protein
MLSGLDITNYDNTLIGWESQAVQSGVSLGATGLEYCNSEVERGRLGTDHSWTITGDSKDCELTKFIAIWKTDNPGTTNDNQIKIPCPPSANYTIEWEEVGNPGNNGSTAASSNYTLTLPSSGTYEIKISGNFVRIQFGGFNDPLKLLSIEQWGSQVWVGMNGAFNGCANMRINAVDKPNLQSVTDMGLTFANCTALNDDIGDWDVSNVSNFNATFNNATSFNQDLGDWDVSSGFSFALMFDGAASFNQDIGSWDVSNGWIMNSMFADATDFNQDISSWEMGTNAFFSGMFSGATAFNQDLSNWDVTGGSDFTSMFSNATSFNQDISTWDMSGATQFAFMFRNASAFDQSLGAWDISGVTGMFSMLDNCGMSMTNYDITLMGWGETASAKNDTGGGSVMAVQPNLSVGVAGLNYCNGESARAALITNEGWTFFGDSKDCFLLPIELSEFTAYRTSNHVDILWSTSSEINNDFFEIQRSVDNESWESIQVVAGAGNSNYLIDYIAIDENPLAGLSYYRIKQVDFDGRMSYTQSVSVNFKMQNEDKLIIYPNPSSDIVQFNSTSNQNQIDVFSQLGQKIDIEIQKQGSVIRVDVSSLPNGVYFISNNSSIGSFVKN